MLAFGRLPSPIGMLTVFTHGEALCAVRFAEDGAEVPGELRRRFGGPFEETPDPAGVLSRFRAYFGGEVDALDAIAVEPAGTPFQQRAWSALRQVRAGTTISYSGLAARMDAPQAVRAVGAANARNPIPLVIPCHRVIGADGSLTGYGGGLERKRWLLEHEGWRPRAGRAQAVLPFDVALVSRRLP
jgi:methylated-DNA-[protein]-cysteine S-methyltransferase